MGYYAAVIDHDERFGSLHEEPIIVNDFDLSTSEAREKFNALITTAYEGETLAVVPSCACGKLRGEYLTGRLCHNCRTEVRSHTERPLESVMWIRAPEGVKGFFNPIVWSILASRFTRNGVNLIEWLCNPLLRVPDRKNPYLEKLASYNIPRGLNEFIENYLDILDTLEEAKLATNDDGSLFAFLKGNAEASFPKHLPIPSNVAFITEKRSHGIVADNTMTPCIDAIRMISNIRDALGDLTQKSLERVTLRATIKLAEFYSQNTKDVLARKQGWFRKHIYGARLHYSFRAVITSISDPHVYDELHVPWALAVTSLQVHLTKKLYDEGYTPREATDFLAEHTHRYHPMLDRFFQELIAESPHKGIPVIFQRNPTLARLSAQLFYITKVKTTRDENDICEDHTISLSVLVLSGPNADFDGDALNGAILLDEKMYNYAYAMSSHFGLLDPLQVRTVSGDVKLPAPVVSTIANWLNEQA